MLRTWELWKPSRVDLNCYVQFERVENELAQIHVGDNACYFCNTFLVPCYIFFFEEERSQFASGCFLLIIAVPEKCVGRKCFLFSLIWYRVNFHIIGISPSKQLGKSRQSLKQGMLILYYTMFHIRRYYM